MKTPLATFVFSVLLCLVLPKHSHGVEGTGNDNPTGVTGEYNGSVTTAGSYDPYTGNAKRFIDDLTVTGSVGAYPLKWTRILNTRGGLGMGGPWRYSYQWDLVILPPEPPGYHECEPFEANAHVSYPDGATSYFHREGNTFTHADQGEPGDRLVHMGGNDYDLRLKDGGRVEFRGSVNYIVDPYGQKTTLEYGSNGLRKVTEPAGRYLEISYATHPTGGTVLDHVTSYDGPGGNAIETVNYHYDAVIFHDTYHGDVTYYTLTRVTYAGDNGPQEATYTYTLPAYQNPSAHTGLVPPKVHICRDVRFNGAMSNIEYEYEAPAGAAGQISAEKNPTTNEYVSRLIYPSGPSDGLTRVEKRPDGATRTFTYSHNADGELNSYTDFSFPNDPLNPPHTTVIDLFYPGSSYNGTNNNPPPETETVDPNHYLRVVTDARDYETKTVKDPNIGAVICVIHHNGSSVAYTYSHPSVPDDSDYPYYVTSKKDENGKFTYYDRDDKNRIWRIRYPDGGFETFTYDYDNPFGLVHEHRMTSGGTEIFTYDLRGRKETYTPPITPSDEAPGTHPTRYFYHEEGPHKDRLRYVVDPFGNATWYDYNRRGQVTKVTYQNNTFTQSEYAADGTLLWHEDELRHKTTYTYDEYKRVETVTNAEQKTVRNDYTPFIGGTRLSHTTSSVYHVRSQMEKVTEYDYDANFRRSRMTVAPNTDEYATTTYTYDPVGNLETVKDPKGQSSGLVTTYLYNDRNLRKSMTDPVPPDPVPHTTTWLYDDVGNMKSETRADGKFRTWDLYDAMNRVKHTTGFLGAILESTSYDYDHAGNLTKMTDANQGVYETLYDKLNRKIQFIYPADAATGSAQSEYWRYDIAGNLLWSKNPANQYKHFRYDDRNRQRRSFWNDSEDGEGANRSMGPETFITPDAASRIEEIKTNDDETIVTYGYDNANHKIWEDQTLAGWGTHRVETLPDSDGNRGTLSVAGVLDGYSFTYEYTQRQQLWHISRGGTPYFEYTYDENGNLTKRQHMIPGQGLDSTVFVYDDINRVTLCDQKQNDSSFFSRSDYNDYDLVNNLKSISRYEDQGKGELFDYDDANQLRGVSYQAVVPPHAPGPGSTAGDSEEVEKDTEREALAALEADPVREPLATLAMDPQASPGPRTVTYFNDSINRRSMTDNGTETIYTPNHLNQYTTVTGHEQSPPIYDTNFNLSGYDDWTYVYDAEKRLTSVTGHNSRAQFVYDGLGRCVKRTIDGVTTAITYDEWKPIVEWGWSNGASQPVAWNLYGPGADEILVRNQPSTAGYLYYHLDALGNVAFLLSDTIQGLEKYTYDAFGTPTIMGLNAGDPPRLVSLFGNRFLFTGREYIYTLGIYDYRHRLYHPALGRFLQTDPIGLQGDAMNLYRYCTGNPIGHSDPTGLEPQANHFTHLGGSDTYTDYANDYQAGVNYSMGVEQKQKEANQPQSLDPTLRHFDIPGAIDKLDAATEEYARRHRTYPDGQAVADGLRKALKDGRIEVGDRSDFIKGNPISSRNGVIKVDPYAKVNVRDFPSLLAHDGQHIIDKVHESDKGFMRERRAYDVQHGFGELTGSTRPRMTDDDIRGYYNIPKP